MRQPFSLADLVQCAERELAQRRYVYPRRVENGTMSQESADRQIAMMECIREALVDLCEAREQPTLFPLPPKEV